MAVDKDKIINDMSDDLYAFLKARSDDKSNSDYFSGGIHCSSLDSCVRQVVMGYFKFPKKDLTIAELLMFEIANFCHRLMADWARQSDKFSMIGEEYDLTKGLPENVSGKCDIVIKHNDTDTVILADTKTAMPAAFKQYSQYLVKRSHELQGSTYKYGLKNLGTLIDLVIFTYFDRGGTNAPVYVAMPEMPDEVIEDTINVYREAVKEYEVNKKLPDKEPLIFETKGNDVCVKKSWQCDYCLAPNTRILTTKLEWKPLDSVRLGDKLMSFNESIPDDYNLWRKWEVAEVISIEQIKRPCYEILLKNGDSIIASKEHKWLTPISQRNGGMYNWKKTYELFDKKRVDSPAPVLLKILDVWTPATDFMAGYLSAAFDGEGTMYQGKSAKNAMPFDISFAQKENSMSELVKQGLKQYGFKWTEWSGSINDVTRFRIKGSISEKLRFLGQIRPIRFINKFKPEMILKFSVKEKVEVVGLNYIGEKNVIAVKTSSKTFIAEGYASHNCKFCDISCKGYPDFDRKKAVKIGKVVGEQLEVNDKFINIQDELLGQYEKQKGNSKDFYNFVKTVSK